MIRLQIVIQLIKLVHNDLHTYFVHTRFSRHGCTCARRTRARLLTRASTVTSPATVHVLITDVTFSVASSPQLYSRYNTDTKQTAKSDIVNKDRGIVDVSRVSTILAFECIYSWKQKTRGSVS